MSLGKPVNLENSLFDRLEKLRFARERMKLIRRCRGFTAWTCFGNNHDAVQLATSAGRDGQRAPFFAGALHADFDLVPATQGQRERVAEGCLFLTS